MSTVQIVADSTALALPELSASALYAPRGNVRFAVIGTADIGISLATSMADTPSKEARA